MVTCLSTIVLSGWCHALPFTRPHCPDLPALGLGRLFLIVVTERASAATAFDQSAPTVRRGGLSFIRAAGVPPFRSSPSGPVGRSVPRTVRSLRRRASFSGRSMNPASRIAMLTCASDLLWLRFPAGEGVWELHPHWRARGHFLVGDQCLIQGTLSQRSLQIEGHGVFGR